MNFILKNNYPHIVAVLFFILISVFYLSPVLDGFSLKQDDINNHKGVAKEIKDHRKEYNEEPLWTNSMFGGMPATQVSVIHSSNLMNYVHRIISVGLPHPIDYLFLYLLGFYILCICSSIKPWLSILGAIMFGLSSFFFISLSVGHNSKIMAMAYMPMIIGAFVFTMRNKAIIGTILFALFLALELRSNHVQITYYAFIIILALGIGEFIRFTKNKDLKSFFKRSGLLVIATSLSVLCNFGNLFMTYDYLPDSQRGPSELSSTLLGEDVTANNGLDIDYMTNWSYGIGETLNLVIPNAKGGGSGAYLLEENLMESSEVSNGLKKFIKNAYQKGWTINTYWGNQPSTAGPVYIGASVFLLFIFGLFFLRDRIKWPLLIVLLLAIFLSWGHNWMFLTNLFAKYFPVYSKFRSVTMILVIAELIVPMIGILWLFQFTEDKNFFSREVNFRFNKASSLKLFYILSSFIIVFFLSFIIVPDLFLNFISSSEKQIINQLTFMDSQTSNYVEELIDYRKNILSQDVLRSLLIVLIIIGSLFLFIKRKISMPVLLIVVGLVTFIDMWGVSKRYLHNNEHSGLEQQLTRQSGLKHWQDQEIKIFPHSPKPADIAIRDYEISENNSLRSNIQKRMREVLNEYEDSDYRNRIANIESFTELNFNTNYRVLEMGNPLNTARTSFLHKSIGGYSAVKVKRVQELIDFYFQKEYNNINSSLKNNQFNLLKSNNFFNMLNVKYFIFNLDGNGIIDLNRRDNNQTPGVLKNPFALGNAWSVQNIKWVSSPDEEILAVGDSLFNPKFSVIIDEKYRKVLGDISTSGESIVSMQNYKANQIDYLIDAKKEELIVFSEVFYDKGWKVFVDGVETSHIRANYVLRALKVSPGTHKITFKYDLPIYNTASIISFSSSLVIILLFFMVLLFKFKAREFPEI